MVLEFWAVWAGGFNLVARVDFTSFETGMPLPERKEIYQVRPLLEQVGTYTFVVWGFVSLTFAEMIFQSLQVRTY